jgi:hypothetical protein
MMPEEWPIAAPVTERSAPARVAGRGRLSTVRIDFFLDPAERLSEQERALMTVMLHQLIGDLAAEIRAALPAGWPGANDEDAGLIERLQRTGLLDDPELIALLLRRAEEDRIATTARARSGRREARALQALVSANHSALSAAAMALIIARGRRRDRFGHSLLAFDDLPDGVAERLVHATAAGLRQEISVGRPQPTVDAELGQAAVRILANRDESRSADALMAALAALAEEADALTDDLLLACAREGEIGFIAAVLARRTGCQTSVAFDELMRADARHVMGLLRAARFSRDVAAGFLASVSDLIGISDPGAAIAEFDRTGADEAEAVAARLSSPPAYLAALGALGSDHG